MLGVGEKLGISWHCALHICTLKYASLRCALWLFTEVQIQDFVIKMISR